MSYQLAEINRRLQQDPAAFLEECEQGYSCQVEQAVEGILENLTNSPIVLLSGPSGSGKTTSAMKIEEELKKRGGEAHAIALDNYFRNLDGETAPRTPEGDIDYESPALMDMELLDETFTRLSEGEEVIIPRFEFARQMRNDDRGRPLCLGKNEVAIFEGIHALNDDIAGRHPEASTLYVSARSDIKRGNEICFKGTWMRFSRRAVRDYNYRGTDLVATLNMWVNVRRGEKLYISPFKHRAKWVVDSSLPYEPSLFANYAQPMQEALESIPQENPRRKEFGAMLEAFQRFVPVEEALVPKESILREFIGGGSYQYK